MQAGVVEVNTDAAGAAALAVMVAATPEAAHAAQAGRSPGFTPREVRTRIQYHAPFLLVDNLPPRPLVILLDNVRHWGLHLPTGCCWVRLVMRLRLPTAWLGLALGVGAGPGKPSEWCSLGGVSLFRSPAHLPFS